MSLLQIARRMKVEAEQGKLAKASLERGLVLQYWEMEEEVGKIRFLTLFRKDVAPSAQEAKIVLPLFFEEGKPVFRKIQREKRFKHFIQFDSGDPFKVIEMKLIEQYSEV